MTDMLDYFSRPTGKLPHYFSPATGSEGKCELCGNEGRDPIHNYHPLSRVETILEIKRESGFTIRLHIHKNTVEDAFDPSQSFAIVEAVGKILLEKKDAEAVKAIAALHGVNAVYVEYRGYGIMYRTVPF